MVAREGALYGGMIFAEESKRRVSEAQAEAIAARAREASVGLPLVGVFVNEAAARVAGLARSLGLAAVQLHGDEDTGYVAQLRALLPDRCEVWKVQQPGPLPRRAERDDWEADARSAAGVGIANPHGRKVGPSPVAEIGGLSSTGAREIGCRASMCPIEIGCLSSTGAREIGCRGMTRGQG
ncbi:MAG: hypothetical protein R3F14_03215 [Polyangiaceae bacterium]